MRLVRIGPDHERAAFGLVVGDADDGGDLVWDLATDDLRVALATARTTVTSSGGGPRSAERLAERHLWAPVAATTVAEMEGNSTAPDAAAPAASGSYPRLTLLPDTVVNHPAAAVAVPSWSRRLAVAAQVAFVCGDDVTAPDEVGAHSIAGYLLMVSVADWTLVDALDDDAAERDRSMNEDYGRWFDGYRPMGPWLVTPDELPSLEDCVVELTVGSRPPAIYRGATMRHRPLDILRTLSTCFPFAAGDVIGLGAWGPEVALDPVSEPIVSVTVSAGELGTLACSLERAESPLHTGSPLDRAGMTGPGHPLQGGSVSWLSRQGN